MKILHLSDLHIHAVHESENIPVIAKLEYIDTYYPTHMIMITGDIVDDGMNEQYQRAYKMLEPFTGRLLLVPGNHDKGIAGNWYSDESSLSFDMKLSLRLDQTAVFYGSNSLSMDIIDDVLFVGLDSCLETNEPFRFAKGKIGSKQLNQLKGLLNHEPCRTVVLYFHHHPFMHTDPFMWLEDAEQLAEVIYGKVSVLCFGHKHVARRYDNTWNIPYILAAGSIADLDYCNEISIDGGDIHVQSVPLLHNCTGTGSGLRWEKGSGTISGYYSTPTATDSIDK